MDVEKRFSPSHMVLKNEEQLITISEFMAEYEKADNARRMLWRMFYAAMGSEIADAWDCADRASILRFYDLTVNLITLTYQVFGTDNETNLTSK